MAIIRLTADNFDRLELLANPRRSFVSSSIGPAGIGSVAPGLTYSGITGSVPLFADASSAIKDVEPTFGDAQGKWDASQIDLYRNTAVMAASGYYSASLTPAGPQEWIPGTTNIESSLKKYLELVNSMSAPVRSTKRQEVLRFTPGVTFQENFLRKSAVKESLFAYWRNIYPSAQWAYSNYHSLNFVTGGNLTTNSVMIYPAGTGTVPLEDTNPYGPSTAFTFDFYINPRYTTEEVGGHFKAGTILHMSSCYAISLVTGSSIGVDGKKDGYRMLLQLSSSANIPPSLCSITGDSVTTTRAWDDPGQLYVSSDNSLKKNHWHHVAIRWGGPLVNGGVGSFVIDGKEDNQFTITSSSIMQASSPGLTTMDPDGLFVGNFYEGNNEAPDNQIALFFNPAAHRDDGVVNFSNSLPSNDPADFTFAHPLNAEVHDVKISNKYKLISQIRAGSEFGSKLAGDLLFYVPPFFTKDSRKRLVLQTPFFDAYGSTEDPFNVALSFGIGGLEINLENFVKDFVTDQFPRLLHLSAARIDTQVNIPETANFLLYESGSSVKRNLTLLPCDNGKFFPNFDLLKKPPPQGLTNIPSGTFAIASYSGSFDDRFVDDFGNLDYSLISLKNMVATSSLMPGRVPTRSENSGSLLLSLEGATPEDPGVAPGNILSVLQRTHDPSSNEVVFFDASNLFYGDLIEPGTVLLEDLCVSGTSGRMTFKVRDDENGNLYRADALSANAKWASVGNVLYEEGIIVIKSPHMNFFGKDAFRLSFAGQKYVYVLEIMVPAQASLFNSSTNPTYKALAPTNYSNETAKRFSYLTGINLHDNNFNVIGRANFAQPIIKRAEDKIMVRLRMDF